MIEKVRNLWFILRSSLWFVPTLMVVGAIALSFITLFCDEAIRDTWIREVDSIFNGGPEGARAVLATIAGSMIGIAGVTFSITIVTLTLASSQFGPRLLLNFMRDWVNQIVLGTFIATFVYCLLILRTVRDIDDVQFVPYISTTCGLAMAVLSLGMLIYFIHHVSVSIQADTVISSVSHDLLGALNRLFPEQEQPVESDTGSLIPGQLNRLLGDMARDGRPIMANQSGYLQVINKNQLVQLAIDHQCLIRFEYRPGDFITQDCPLATILPGTHADNGLSAAIHDVLMIGKQRTYEQDVGFAFHQLVEIAVRALSPGINDPFTAVACIERLGASFCQLAKRSVPSVYQFDDDGQLRAIVPNLTFVDVVQGVLDPIRQYCRSSLTVTLQLLRMMTVVAPHVSQEAHRDILLRQAEMIVRGCYDGLPEKADREQVEACHQEVKRALQP